VVTEKPRDCWNIIAFDILVMNGDRHRRNISYDATTKKLTIFDNSHALLGQNGDISARLGNNIDKLAIGGHCLAREINTEDGRAEAVARIKQIPNFLIDGVTEAACEVGLAASLRRQVSDFLKQRRDGIGNLLDANKTSFPKLP
jgi:hypothetical protein